MTTQGIILIDFLGIAFIILIVNLFRTQKLYIGYAILWLLSVIGLMIIISFPPLLGLVTKAVGAVFPVSALTLLAFVFFFFILIIFSLKLSDMKEQQTELIQMIALRELHSKEELSLRSDLGKDFLK